MGLRGKRCGAGEHVRKGRMGGGARGGRGCGAGGRGGKRCGPQEHVRNGLMRGRQRYRCKACGLNFTDTPPRGMPLATKGTAARPYPRGLPVNRTAKLLGVSTPSVM